MLKSQVIEANSFSQSRCEFSLPQKMAASIKIAHLGVFGGAGYCLDGQLGQVSVIRKITLRQGGTVLSQYDRYFRAMMDFKLLQSANSFHRNIGKQLHASNYGMCLNDGGADTAANAVAGLAVGEQAVRPRICIDKKDLKEVAVAEGNTDFAIFDIADALGFCSAVYQDGGNTIGGVIPCHIFNNLRLSIEFEAPANVCAAATTVAQPYLIFNEVDDPALAQKFMNRSLAAQYVDLELESLYLGAGLSSRSFLNGFYGKTIGNLVIMTDIGDPVPLSYYQTGEVVRLLVNNSNLIQLTTGIDHAGKKAAFTRMMTNDLSIVSMADRIFADNTNYAASANASATSIYEGPANAASTETNWYSEASQSYLVLPIQTKISQLQLDYSRTANTPISLLFWGEVAKVLSFDNTGSAVISYM
jgi:hypothetical protein